MPAANLQRIGVIFAVLAVQGQSFKRLDLQNENLTDDAVFLDEARWRGPLRTWIRDPEIGRRARWLLLLIGYPEDARRIAELEVDSHEMYIVVTGLLAPQTVAEWQYLRRALTGEFDTFWPNRGAVQSLRLLGTPPARRILEEARATAGRGQRLAERVMANPWPPQIPMEHTVLPALADGIAQAFGAGRLERIGPPRFNRAQDKALVDFTYRAGWDQLIYTATFHRTGRKWVLRGVREVVQYLVPPGPATFPNPSKGELPDPPPLSPIPRNPFEQRP